MFGMEKQSRFEERIIKDTWWKWGDTLLISPSHCRELANPELKVSAWPIGGTFVDELCLIMICFDRGKQSNDY